MLCKTVLQYLKTVFAEQLPLVLAFSGRKESACDGFSSDSIRLIEQSHRREKKLSCLFFSSYIFGKPTGKFLLQHLKELSTNFNIVEP